MIGDPSGRTDMRQIMSVETIEHNCEQFKKLFDRFYTVGNERGDGRRGLGLGLSLCKSIITAHGGTIEAIPNHPQGTVFRFTLHASEVNAHE